VVATFLILALAASPVGAQTDPKATADEHFKKGVDAFRDRRFGDAALEFEEAYRLWPAYAVLFNIGQVNAALGHSVEAVDAYEKYLKQGAAAVPASRVREVEAEIAKQLDRIGTVAVRTSPEGAEIRMDGRLLGTTPLGRPIRATVGRHTFDAILDGHGSQVREVDVVGRAERKLDLKLEAIPAPKAANAALPATAPPPPAPSPPVVTIVEIPRPESAYPAPKAPPAAPSASPSFNWQRAIGYVLAIGGLATATTDGLLAYDGANKMNDANSRLAMATTAAEYDKLKPAYAADYAAGKHRSHVGWTVAGIGAAALLGGVIVIATAPERTYNANVAWTLTPIVASAGTGLSLGGAW
jgi:tetratricopeptide (TPR) repeat protein